MATGVIPFLSPVDMNSLEIQNVRLHMLASDPATPADGLFWLNTTTNLYKFRAGSVTYVITTTASASGVQSVTATNTTITIAGTAADPTVGIALLGITNAHISASAAIALNKLAVDPLARANHTGTQLAATVSDFDTQVRTSRLDQMAAPTAVVSLNSQRLTTLADPTADTDGANKRYVDQAVREGLDVKGSVRAATTAALPANTRSGNVLTASANAALAAQDGATLIVGDRLLVKDEATGANNGLYSVSAVGSGAAPWTLTRTTDADVTAEVSAGLYTFASEGTSQGNTAWVLTTDDPITLNTTALVFTQYSGAGQITAGAALTKTGDTLDVAADNASLEINADALRVKALGVTNAMLAGSIDLTTKVTGSLPIANGGTAGTTAATARTSLGVRAAPQGFDMGDASATAFVLTHNIGSYDVTVQVFRNSGDRETVNAIVERTSTNTCTIRFATAPTAAQYRAVVS